jgi:hypothetical protein
MKETGRVIGMADGENAISVADDENAKAMLDAFKLSFKRAVNEENMTTRREIFSFIVGDIVNMHDNPVADETMLTEDMEGIQTELLEIFTPFLREAATTGLEGGELLSAIFEVEMEENRNLWDVMDAIFEVEMEGPRKKRKLCDVMDSGVSGAVSRSSSASGSAVSLSRSSSASGSAVDSLCSVGSD